MIHIYDDEDFSEVRSFVSEITKNKKMLALRLPHDLDNYSILLNLSPIVYKMIVNFMLF